MIGVKMNRHTIRHAFNKTKSFVGRAYNQTKGMLSELDAGVRMAKDIYIYIVLLLDPWRVCWGRILKRGINMS